jgi:symplekin
VGIKRPNFFLSQQDPNLLDNFLDEVIGFQKDRSQEVRKFLIGFIEEACKKDPEVLPKVITNLQIFMADDGLAIRKRVIQVFANFQFFVVDWFNE